jgi:hypothetical protein
VNPPPLIPKGEIIEHSEDKITLSWVQEELEKRATLRTLNFKGGSTVDANGNITLLNSVTLKNVHIKKGLYPSLGGGGNSGAIYLVGLNKIDFDNVEIYGKGEGFGVYVSASKNVHINALNIHDIYWEPKIGGRRNFSNLISTFSWNNGPFYSYNLGLRMFVEKRFDEVASGIVFADSSNILLTNSNISNIYVKKDNQNIPWQADGITVSTCSDVSFIKNEIGFTGNAVDLSGNGNLRVYVQELKAHDNLSYGFKIAHENSDHIIRDSVFARNGMHGITVKGHPDELVSNITFYNNSVLDTGYINLTSGDQLLDPWEVDEVIAVDVRGEDTTGTANPKHVRFIKTTISNENAPINIDYGLYESPNATFIHNVANATTVISPSRQGSNFKNNSPNLYTYGDTDSNFRQIIGCDGTLNTLVSLWDKSHSSVMNPAWTLDDLRNHLATNKLTYQQKCPNLTF